MPNEVIFHLNETDFTGGEVVAGELELKIDTAIPVRGVRVLFHGYEQSYWGGALAEFAAAAAAGFERPILRPGTCLGRR